MKISELIEKTGFSLATRNLETEAEVTGVYCGDLLSWVMGRAREDNAWITIMSNVNVVAVATLADTAVVILAEGVELPGDVQATARAKGVNILSISMPAYETALALSELLA